jgi:hypothetical protein
VCNALKWNGESRSTEEPRSAINYLTFTNEAAIIGDAGSMASSKYTQAAHAEGGEGWANARKSWSCPKTGKAVEKLDAMATENGGGQMRAGRTKKARNSCVRHRVAPKRKESFCIYEVAEFLEQKRNLLLPCLPFV